MTKRVEDCSHEELLLALQNLEKTYPAVYKHFFLDELQPDRLTDEEAAAWARRFLNKIGS